MGNYLKMIDIQRIQALLELGWSYRRIERETGVRRETIARYDPRHVSNATQSVHRGDSKTDTRVALLVADRRPFSAE